MDQIPEWAQEAVQMFEQEEGRHPEYKHSFTWEYLPDRDKLMFTSAGMKLGAPADFPIKDMQWDIAGEWWRSCSTDYLEERVATCLQINENSFYPFHFH